MNREIKFRAWDKKEKKMFLPDCITLSYEKDSVNDGYYYEKAVNPKDDKFILMQYTGLKDKNGKEIFEGDIAVVRSLHDGDEYVWNNEKQQPIPFGISWHEFGFAFGNSCMSYRPYDYEVIGNIFENIELLKT